MENRRYVLISGYKGAGKTTVAEYLLEKLSEAGIKTEICSLSSIIKDDVRYMTGHTLSEIERLKRDPSSNMRKFLQVYGALMREKRPDFFLRRIEPQKDTQIVIVPEVRFPNEIQYFQKKGKCIALYIVRDILMDDMDASEQMAIRGNLPADFTIENSGTLQDLYKMISTVAERILNDLS